MSMSRLPKLNPGKVSRADPSPALPFFFCEKVYIDDQPRLEVTCQRTGCKQMFIVKERAWRKSSEAITRPCPYCFKVSKVPS